MICAIHSRGSMPPVNGPYKAAGPARRGSRNSAPGAAGPEPPPGMCRPLRAAHAENLGPTGAVGPSASTEDGTRTREPGLCRRHVVLPVWALPPGASAPAVSGLSGDTGDGVQPGMLPGPRRRQQPGPAGHGPGGKRVGPGDRATAAPVAPVALFPGTDGGGGYTDHRHQGTRWGWPGLGSADERASGAAGPGTPQSPHAGPGRTTGVEGVLPPEPGQ